MTPLICLAGLGLGPSFLPKALFVSNVSERTAAMTASEYYHTLHIFHFSFQVFILVKVFLLFLLKIFLYKISKNILNRFFSKILLIEKFLKNEKT